MINGTICWVTKYIFSISLITRKCSVTHEEVKINYFEKKLGHCFSNMLISKTYILSFEIVEKMVADNSKMASTMTTFKNLQIFMQQIEFLNEK